jgi:hypothetical protein
MTSHNELIYSSRPTSPLSPLPVSEQARLSTASINPRYSLDATVEQILDGCVASEIEEEFDFCLNDYGGKFDNFIVDASALRSATLDNALNEFRKHTDQIFSIRLAKPKHLSVNDINRFLPYVCRSGFLKYLVELDLSYFSIPGSSLKSLCSAVNPILSGYCPMKRLTLVRCSLQFKGVKYLLEAATQNIFLEELILTGNNATDEAIPYLNQYLSFNLNKIRVLGLGDNEISTEGAQALATVLGKHKYLSCLLLSGNPIGDTGAESLLMSIRDSSKFKHKS